MDLTAFFCLSRSFSSNRYYQSFPSMPNLITPSLTSKARMMNVAFPSDRGTKTVDTSQGKYRTFLIFKSNYKEPLTTEGWCGQEPRLPTMFVLYLTFFVKENSQLPSAQPKAAVVLPETLADIQSMRTTKKGPRQLLLC